VQPCGGKIWTAGSAAVAERGNPRLAVVGELKSAGEHLTPSPFLSWVVFSEIEKAEDPPLWILVEDLRPVLDVPHILDSIQNIRIIPGYDTQQPG
jgi:hypothetical protein